jgi:hypothetical protein
MCPIWREMNRVVRRMLELLCRKAADDGSCFRQVRRTAHCMVIPDLVRVKFFNGAWLPRLDYWH